MYVLENDKEALRLEAQSKIGQYSVADELRSIKFPDNGIVLDAGCGTGLLSQKVSELFPNLIVKGCDLSQERIKFAQKNYTNIDFFNTDLINNSLPEKYDLILNRYVAHHLGVEKYKTVLENFYRGLKSSGSVGIIDIENIIIGLGTTNKWLEEQLQKINDQFYGDILMGRKIPSLMAQVGFKDIEFKIECMTFKGESLKEEIIQISDRLIFAKEFFSTVVGAENFEKFYELYMESLNTDIFFYNKVIVQGWKL